MTNSPNTSKLRVIGVSRMLDNDRAILVSLDRIPTDNELRVLHETFQGSVSVGCSGHTVDHERVAQLIAHRACCGVEHDPANGKLHGYCVVCGVPWPCQYAGEPPK